jgi:hypothetical protein
MPLWIRVHLSCREHIPRGLVTIPDAWGKVESLIRRLDGDWPASLRSQFAGRAERSTPLVNRGR